jgi:hypothetical protein
MHEAHREIDLATCLIAGVDRCAPERGAPGELGLHAGILQFTRGTPANSQQAVPTLADYMFTDDRFGPR